MYDFIEKFRRRYSTLWDEIKTYFNAYDIGEHATRKGLIEYLDSRGFKEITSIDTYRNYLKQAGYHNIVRRGVYEIVNEIPVDLSVADVRSQAYNPFDIRDADKLEWDDDVLKSYTYSDNTSDKYWVYADSSSDSINSKKKDEFLKEDDFKL